VLPSAIEVGRGRKHFEATSYERAIPYGPPRKLINDDTVDVSAVNNALDA